MIRSSSGGTSPLSRAAGRGVPFRIASKTMADVLPPKAVTPVAISYSTAPNEKRSLRWSSASPRACSGDMYAAVPTVEPAIVRSRAPAAVSMPD